MSGDLISLRALVISAFRPSRDLWRQGAGLASVPIEFVEAEGAEAPALLAAGGIDIVVVDGALEDGLRTRAIKAAGAMTPRPFIALSDSGSAVPFEGIGAVVAKPHTIEEARQLVERCVRTRLPMRVLIVDDSNTMRSIVRKILSGSQYTMELSDAAEGIAALKELSSGRFDLVMLDYNMPNFNGIETLSEIKRVAPRTAVIMMTSTVDEAVATRAKAAGAIGFLKKPFYPGDIDSILDRYYAGAKR